MNLQRYIKIDGIYQLLSEAHKTGRPIYIHSPTGVGKTAAVRYFYRNKKVLWLGEADGKLTAMPPEERIAEDTVIFDDVSFLDDSASQQYITSMIRNGRKHAVILGALSSRSSSSRSASRGSLLRPMNGRCFSRRRTSSRLPQSTASTRNRRSP